MKLKMRKMHKVVINKRKKAILEVGWRKNCANWKRKKRRKSRNRRSVICSIKMTYSSNHKIYSTTKNIILTVKNMKSAKKDEVAHDLVLVHLKMKHRQQLSPTIDLQTKTIIAQSRRTLNNFPKSTNYEHLKKDSNKDKPIARLSNNLKTTRTDNYSNL